MAVTSTVAWTVSGLSWGSGAESAFSSGTRVTDASTFPETSPGFSKTRLCHFGVAGVAPPARISLLSSMWKRPIRSSFENLSSSYTMHVIGGASSSGSGTATKSVIVSYHVGLHVSAFTDDLSVLP